METQKTGPGGIDVMTALRAELELAERKAWESLARYKFQMFGYWAAIWVHHNRIIARVTGTRPSPNPWAGLAKQAKGLMRAIAIIEAGEATQ